MERRNRGSSGSWLEPEKSERQKEQEAEEMQQLPEELQALKVQMAAVHPKVEREADGLRGCTVAEHGEVDSTRGEAPWRCN